MSEMIELNWELIWKYDIFSQTSLAEGATSLYVIQSHIFFTRFFFLLCKCLNKYV